MPPKPAPGPPAAAGGGGTSGKKETVFICWPGDLTGDIWHVAGAHFMAADDPFWKFNAIPVMGVFDEKTHKSFVKGQDSFKYLQDIGVPCIVMKIDSKSIKNLTPNHMRKIPLDEFEKRTAQLQTKGQTFESLWQSDTKVAIPKLNNAAVAAADAEAPDVATADKNPILHLWHTTTIMMKAFEKHLSFTTPEAFTKQYGELSPKLAGGTATPKEVIQLAQTQFGLLEKMFTKTPAVLFNWRIGEVNLQHNSNLNLLNQVKQLVTEASMSFIAIVTGATPEGLATLERDVGPAVPVFDFFMVKTTKVNVDKRYTAHFWKLVAGAQATKKVFGYIGGRSGSMDIASFMGVNCFSWDEMPAAFGIPSELLAIGNSEVRARIGRSPDQTGGQFPQFLRLLNQFPIMDIGALDLTSFANKQYARIIPDFITIWRKTGIIFPNIPKDPATIKSVNEEIVKSLEAPAWGIMATNIRQLLDEKDGVSAPPVPLAPGQTPLPPAGGKAPPPAATAPPKGPGPAAPAPATKLAPTAPVKNPTTPSGAGGAVSGRAEAGKRAP